jgi:hypothetical protein
MTQIEAWLLPLQEVTGRLVAHLGGKYVAALTSNRDSTAADRQRSDDEGPSEPAGKLVRAAHRAWTLVAHEASDDSARAWFITSSAALGEAAFLRLAAAVVSTQCLRRPAPSPDRAGAIQHGAMDAIRA